MTSYVVDEILLLAGCSTKHFPQIVGLDKIFVRHRNLLGHCGTCPLLMLLTRFYGLEGHLSIGGRVVLNNVSVPTGS